MEKVEINRGSGNVYADLGFDNAEELRAKAQLVSFIMKIIKERGLTQQEAADVIGVSQADVSRMTRGHFEKVTIDRLLRMLSRLGNEAIITVRPTTEDKPHLSVTSAL